MTPAITFTPGDRVLVGDFVYIVRTVLNRHEFVGEAAIGRHIRHIGVGEVDFVARRVTA